MVCVWGEWEEFREWKRSKECLKWERDGVQLALLKGLGLKAVHCTAMQCNLSK